ncbi:MAG: tripartite tricarboxylate transporter permease [Nanoarchaeota archaeon]
MIFELLLAFLLGILAGTFTGLFPGIHINLIASLLLLSQPSPAQALILPYIVFIVTMSITHTFIDFIPSIFLGVPEEDTFLSILPGHELFLEGRGQEAVVITLYGAIAALPIILISTPLYLIFLPSFYNVLKLFLPFLLIFLSCYLIFREKEIILSGTIFLLAGFLGYSTFNLPVKEPLLPLLTGLFGLSALIISIKNKTVFVKQQILPLKKITLTKKECFKSFTAAALSAPLCSFLPGIGSSHAATLGSELITQSRRSFLFLIGAINTIVMALSFITLAAINKSRSGTAAAIETLLPNLSQNHIILILSTIILSSLLAFTIGIFLTKIFARSINHINYSKLTLAVIALLFILNLFLTNFYGLLVLLTSTCIGLACIHAKVRRIQLMGALILPTIIFYLTN